MLAAFKKRKAFSETYIAFKGEMLAQLREELKNKAFEVIMTKAADADLLSKTEGDDLSRLLERLRKDIDKLRENGQQ